MVKKRMSNGNGYAQPQLTWANILMSIGTAAVLAGAGWTLFQTQFGYIEKDKENIRAQLERRSDDVNKHFDKIEAELLKRRDEFVDRGDFNGFKDFANSELRRLTLEARRLHDDNLSRSEFKAWSDERTRSFDTLQAGLKETVSRAEQLVQTRASVNDLGGLQRQLDQLAKQIDALGQREDRRHITPNPTDK